MSRRAEIEPETRVGYCCGAGNGGTDRCGAYGALFKIQGMFRYRCADCFEREAGYRHHLSPHPVRSLLVLP